MRIAGGEEDCGEDEDPCCCCGDCGEVDDDEEARWNIFAADRQRSITYDGGRSEVNGRPPPSTKITSSDAANSADTDNWSLLVLPIPLPPCCFT